MLFILSSIRVIIHELIWSVNHLDQAEAIFNRKIETHLYLFMRVTECGLGVSNSVDLSQMDPDFKSAIAIRTKTNRNADNTVNQKTKTKIEIIFSMYFFFFQWDEC